MPDLKRARRKRKSVKAPVKAYRTYRGAMYRGLAEQALASDALKQYRGKAQLIFTSPPFPLNRKKRYGNLQGDEYIDWFAEFAPLFRQYLKDEGSIVIELGNAWLPGTPVMSLTCRAIFGPLKA